MCIRDSFYPFPITALKASCGSVYQTSWEEEIVTWTVLNIFIGQVSNLGVLKPRTEMFHLNDSQCYPLFVRNVNWRSFVLFFLKASAMASDWWLARWWVSVLNFGCGRIFASMRFSLVYFSPRLYLVLTHVMRRPCWCTKQWQYAAQVLHNNSCLLYTSPSPRDA